MPAKTMKLRTSLDEAEVRAKQDQIVGLLGEQQKAEEAKAVAAKRFRDQIKDLKKRIEAIRAEVAELSELREVEIEERLLDSNGDDCNPDDDDAKWVVITRLDTGEEVSRRKLTASERESRSSAWDDLSTLAEE